MKAVYRIGVGIVASFVVVTLTLHSYEVTRILRCTKATLSDDYGFHYRLKLWNKKDLEVHVLKPDGKIPNKTLLKRYADNYRVKGIGGPNMMPVERLSDDYRFCIKEEKFMGPVSFNVSSKNPCWKDPNTNEIRCVPYFYLIGVSKSGTTNMFWRLGSHPEIYSGGSKELHYFDYKRFVDRDTDSLSDYSNFFQSFSKVVKRQIQNGRSKAIAGDGSPCYFFFSLYWPCYHGNRGLTQPRYTNADVIHNLYPGSKLVIAFRDPITRLYSRYLTMFRGLQEKEQNLTALNFHRTVRRAVDLYQRCFEEWSPRHCAYNGTLYAITGIRLTEGMYSVYLKDWLKVFPREQMFIYRFEDYALNPAMYADKVYKFLGVAPLKKNAKVFSPKNEREKEELPFAETVTMLKRFYAPFNRDLQKLLGSEMWSWGYEHLNEFSSSPSFSLS